MVVDCFVPDEGRLKLLKQVVQSLFNLCCVKRFSIYLIASYLFTSPKAVYHCIVVRVLGIQKAACKIKPLSGSFASFFFNFLNFSSFFDWSFWVSQAIFLNFLGRLLINSRNITRKNWSHKLLKNFQECFWIFLTMYVFIYW